VHDSGRIVNPVGAEGQVEGAVVHGVGLALHERTEYANGQQLNPHLLDYKLQTAADAPGGRRTGDSDRLRRPTRE
jgi:CO/xanthine dehydrogenase Mo-binding subunit